MSIYYVPQTILYAGGAHINKNAGDGLKFSIKKKKRIAY